MAEIIEVYGYFLIQIRLVDLVFHLDQGRPMISEYLQCIFNHLIGRCIAFFFAK